MSIARPFVVATAWLLSLALLIVPLCAAEASRAAASKSAASAKSGSSSKSSKNERQAILKKYDKNGDGKISRTERAAARLAIAKLREQKALKRNANALTM